MTKITAGRWSPTNGGGCANVKLGDGTLVKIIESGHGEYADAQCAPSGYSDAELLAIASDAYANLARIYPAYKANFEWDPRSGEPRPERPESWTPKIPVGRLTNSTWKLYLQHRARGFTPVIEIIVPRRVFS
jgi:hypothetical protein